MAPRHTLLARQNRDAASASDSRPRQATALPPYEPLSCPLTEKAQRELGNLSSNHDSRKYEKHLQAAIKNLTSCTGESNDSLYAAKERVRRMAERRERTDEDAEKTEAEETAEYRARELEDKVVRLTAESEKALRDLIDYKQELAQQGNMLKRVTEEVATASIVATANGNAARRSRRRRSVSDDEDEDADYEDIHQEDVEMSGTPSQILNPTELLRRAKEEHNASYTSMTMRTRYADDNDYIGFKKIIHDAQHPGENAPPMSHSSTWFPAETANVRSNPAAARRRRLATQTDHTENGDEEEDEILMTGVISSLKCPLTLKTFKEPYSNRICKHTFEKSAILEFHKNNAVSFVDPSQAGRRGRNAPQGPKQLKCPAQGCDAMLELKDFYDDQVIFRQVKRQEAQAAAEMEGDVESGDDVVIPGTQRNPQEFDESGFRSYIGDDTEMSVKDERRSRRSSRRPKEETVESEEEEDDPEPIEMD